MHSSQKEVSSEVKKKEVPGPEYNWKLVRFFKRQGAEIAMQCGNLFSPWLSFLQPAIGKKGSLFGSNLNSVSFSIQWR